MADKEKNSYIFLVIFVSIVGFAIFSWYSNCYQHLAFCSEATMSFWKFYLYFLGSGILVAIGVLSIWLKIYRKRRIS